MPGWCCPDGRAFARTDPCGGPSSDTACQIRARGADSGARPAGPRCGLSGVEADDQMRRNATARRLGWPRVGLGEVVAGQADAGGTFAGAGAAISLPVVGAGAALRAVRRALVERTPVGPAAFGAKAALADRTPALGPRGQLSAWRRQGRARRGGTEFTPGGQRRVGRGRWGRPNRPEPIEKRRGGMGRELGYSHLAPRHKFAHWIPFREPQAERAGILGCRARTVLGSSYDRTSCTRANPNISSMAVASCRTARTSMRLAIQASEGSASVPNENSW